MAHRIYETTTHDFDPVNKYIDEKARLRRTKSTWRYTKALALFLIAFGLFLILAAYAYHIFKKPHDRLITEDRIIKSEEKIKQNLNEEIPKSFNYAVGLVEGTETIVFMVLCLLFPNLFIYFSFIFIILCLITIVFRIIVCYKELS